MQLTIAFIALLIVLRVLSHSSRIELRGCVKT